MNNLPWEWLFVSTKVLSLYHSSFSWPLTFRNSACSLGCALLGWEWDISCWNELVSSSPSSHGPGESADKRGRTETQVRSWIPNNSGTSAWQNTGLHVKAKDGSTFSQPSSLTVEGTCWFPHYNFQNYNFDLSHLYGLFVANDAIELWHWNAHLLAVDALHFLVLLLPFVLSSFLLILLVFLLFPKWEVCLWLSLLSL